MKSLITTATAESNVNNSFRAIRLCIEDTAVGTSLQNLHWELLERETAWQTLETPVLVSRVKGARQSYGKHGVASKMYNIFIRFC